MIPNVGAVDRTVRLGVGLFLLSMLVHLKDRRRMALELLESRWAKLDPDGYLTVSEDGRGGYSESVRKRAFVAFFRKDREAAMARFERSSLRERWHDATIMLGEAAGNDPGWMVGRCARLPEQVACIDAFHGHLQLPFERLLGRPQTRMSDL